MEVKVESYHLKVVVNTSVSMLTSIPVEHLLEHHGVRGQQGGSLFHGTQQ